MKKIFITVGNILIATTILGLALDIVKWTVTDKMGDASENMIVKLIDQITQIPIKLIDSAIKLVFKVIESAVRMVVSLVAGADAAKAIDFTS